MRWRVVPNNDDGACAVVRPCAGCQKKKSIHTWTGGMLAVVAQRAYATSLLEVPLARAEHGGAR